MNLKQRRDIGAGLHGQDYCWLVVCGDRRIELRFAVNCELLVEAFRPRGGA